MKPSEIVGEHYRIVRELGVGSSGTSYEAVDVRTDATVVVKELSLHAAEDWKSVELFEREAQTLARLEHPSIPRYQELIRLDEDGHSRLLLVREMVAGKSLAELVKGGWRPGEHEVRAIAAQLLLVLAYLHELAPPIVHRDVKPENLIRGANGRVSLVDFGSVQRTGQHGSTIAGTYGYMAPEQFRGAAVAASDLHGLGATLIYLLSGRTPSELPVKRLALQFHSHVRASRALVKWLDRMVAPQIEDRFESARAALDALRQPARRTRGLVPVVAIVALAIAGGAVITARPAAMPEPPGPVEVRPPTPPDPTTAQDQVPRALPQRPTKAGQFAQPLDLVVDASNVYWISRAAVFTVPKGGGPVTTLASDQRSPSAIAADASYVYWTNYESNAAGSINRVLKRGGPVTTLALDGNSPGAFAVKGQRVEWASQSRLKNYFSSPLPDHDHRFFLSVVAVDDKSIYWIAPGSYSIGGGRQNINDDAIIYKVAKDGGTVVAIAPGQASPSAMALNETSVFWMNANGTLNTVGKNGGAITVLASDQRSPQGLAVDGLDVYWANVPASTGAIQTVSIHGGVVTTLATCPHLPAAISVHGGHVYWTDVATGEHHGDLYRVAKSGGAVTILASGSPPRQRHALAVDDSGVYWSDGVLITDDQGSRVDEYGGKVLKLGPGASTPVALLDIPAVPDGQAVARSYAASVTRTCWGNRGGTFTVGAGSAGGVTFYVHATVDENGSVSKTTVSNLTATGNDPVLTACVEAAVRTWRFAPTGSPVTHGIPFSFVRAGSP